MKHCYKIAIKIYLILIAKVKMLENFEICVRLYVWKPLCLSNKQKNAQVCVFV